MLSVYLNKIFPNNYCSRHIKVSLISKKKFNKVPLISKNKCLNNKDQYTINFDAVMWVILLQVVNQNHGNNHSYEPIPIVLCGNKCDVIDKRQVKTTKGEKVKL